MKFIDTIKSKYKDWHEKRYGFYKFFDIDFDYTQPMHPEAYEILKKGGKILTDLNIPYTINMGTLLGMYRDGHLIPHDSDIDIGIHYTKDTERIKKAFLKNGFRLGCEIIVMGKVTTLVFVTPNNTIFDILLWEELKDGYYCFHDNFGYWKMPKECFNKFELRDFNGDMLGVPNDIEGLLVHIYGENWKLPMKSKSKNWFDDYYGSFFHVGSLKKVLAEVKRLRNDG